MNGGHARLGYSASLKQSSTLSSWENSDHGSLKAQIPRFVIENRNAKGESPLLVATPLSTVGKAPRNFSGKQTPGVCAADALPCVWWRLWRILAPAICKAGWRCSVYAVDVDAGGEGVAFQVSHLSPWIWMVGAREGNIYIYTR